MQMKLLIIAASLLFIGCSKSNIPNYSYNEYYSPQERIIIPDKIISYEYRKDIPYTKRMNTSTTATQRNLRKRFKHQERKKNILFHKKKEPHTFNIRAKKRHIYDYHDHLIANAKSMLGVPYKWGANGPYAYDCSSFVKKIYLDSTGINLPRVSRDQAKVGRYVSKRNLIKGDLVFFRDKKSYGVKHVGIYLGNGRFIHDSSTTMQVKINSLNEPYYRKYFKHGRRLI